ncbi:hypothetical protein IQ235_02015 [Oscillatoriales cyanobacterium LEGE 11467]|uniref:Uncharacterized protein n=1 Tax=Zarconia navalis LEGE 11467 TaxID=1828826 RepID=A0A928VVN3_9CYAN|nr:hypothetical protein [Zarconia navalis]MBE9039572.1 hypothetical protein [Zarconia navalis LEGE 11467]
MNSKISVSNSQLDRLSEYSARWHEIGLCTETIDPQKARSTIGVLYRALGLTPPKVEFFCGIGDFEQYFHQLKQPPGFPHSLLPASLRPRAMSLTGLLGIYFDRHLIQPIKTRLPQSIFEEIIHSGNARRDADTFKTLIVKEFDARDSKDRQSRLSSLNFSPTHNRGEQLFERSFGSQITALYDGAWLDWAITECQLGSHVTQAWWLFKMLARHTGFIFPTRELCLVCDRPKRLVLDSDRTGKPAIDYGDGFRVYAADAQRIPPEIGSIPLEEWDARWLLQADLDRETRHCIARHLKSESRTIAQLQAKATARQRYDNEYVLLESPYSKQPLLLCKDRDGNLLSAWLVPEGTKTIRTAVTLIAYQFQSAWLRNGEIRSYFTWRSPHQNKAA